MAIYLHMAVTIFAIIFSSAKCKVQLRVIIDTALQLYKCAVRMMDRTYTRLIEEQPPLTDHQTRQP